MDWNEINKALESMFTYMDVRREINSRVEQQKIHDITKLWIKLYGGNEDITRVMIEQSAKIYKRDIEIGFINPNEVFWCNIVKEDGEIIGLEVYSLESGKLAD